MKGLGGQTVSRSRVCTSCRNGTESLLETDSQALWNQILHPNKTPVCALASEIYYSKKLFSITRIVLRVL